MTVSPPEGAARRSFQTLPAERLHRLEGWGMVDSSLGYVYSPSDREQALDVLQLARSSGRSVVARGSGYSYGDTALNAENIVLDLTWMNRLLGWDPKTGIIHVEPGFTIRDLWRHVISDGWWPPVVPGAMHPSLGGCVSSNIHGKNNWRTGTIGEHLLSAEFLLPSGDVVTISPDENAPLFWAAVGGVGLLGVFLSLTLQMEPIQSGLLDVQQHACPTLEAMFEAFEQNINAVDYAVGWIDGFAPGGSLGRGLVQLVRYRAAESVEDRASLEPSAQDLGDKILGLLPRSWLWIGMKPMVYDRGMQALNAGRYRSGAIVSGKTSQIPIAKFEFFHDYVPDWKRSFKPGGILQYQAFVPKEAAREVFTALLRASQRAAFFPRLTVFKRHRADSNSLLSYNVDGYSLSLDYHATTSNLATLKSMLSGLTDQLVLPAGGRFYLAKDNLLTPVQARECFGTDAYDRFLELKEQYDPGQVLQSDLYRRVFSP